MQHPVSLLDIGIAVPEAGGATEKLSGVVGSTGGGRKTVCVSRAAAGRGGGLFCSRKIRRGVRPAIWPQRRG